ncbi:MAG: Si-specific NAD(P)(+) transhydrogenase [Terriglobales bacterium]
MTAPMFDYDLLVIGSGPAGRNGAISAAKLKKRVAIVDRKWPVGKFSASSGTISSKTLREAVLSRLRQRTFNESPGQDPVTMKDLTSRLESVIHSEAEMTNSLLQRYHVDQIEGEASFVEAHTVQIQNRQGTKPVTAENFLIAVGTHPAQAQRIPVDGRYIYNSDQFLALHDLPRDLIIVGAGLIGIEYASLLAALGVKVTLVDQRSELLGFVDREVVANFRSYISQLGVSFQLGERVIACGTTADHRVFAKLESGQSIQGDSLLYTIGREGNTAGLNLAAVGLKTMEGGKLEVNEQFRTAVPNIYAAGDVIGFPVEELYYGSISMEQGRLAICNAFGMPAVSRPHVFPYAIYAIPEISMVGQTEQALAARKIPHESGIAHFGELAKGHILGDRQGFLKLLFDPDSLKILGVHIIGESAAEIVHTGQAAISFGGTIEYFRDTVFNYPTLAEAYKAAALDGLKKVGLVL